MNDDQLRLGDWFAVSDYPHVRLNCSVAQRVNRGVDLFVNHGLNALSQAMA